MPTASAAGPLLHVELLHIQRELLNIPRGRDRFNVYLGKMITPRRDLALPLSAFNPMSKEHVAQRLDELRQLDAERILRQAIAEANARLGKSLAPRPAGLVMADDFAGGWTNRYQTEATARFGKVTKIERDWLVILCWSSEQPSASELRQAALEQIYRGQSRLTFGQPRTLEAMLRQEGAAQRFAERTLAKDAAAVTQHVAEVLAEHRTTGDYPTAFACLYGDEAATSIGYAPRGIPARGGFALALAEALQDKRPPEAILAG